ncbi:MAG: hypothetical protein RSB52_08775 [Acidaminococcaceae bacterium]
MNKVVETNQTSSGICWPGVLAGLVLGAFLFWVTIQVISLLMFSRTAS